MSNEDGSVWVVFNGEIYNHDSLRRQLSGLGHIFRTRSDTEVIVHAYEEFGEDAVQHFRGMFAFALWDGVRRRLLLVRDRLGIKPLYYALRAEGIFFASEIKAFLPLPQMVWGVDPEALEFFLTLRYVPGPWTGISGIRKLMPGELLLFDGEKATARRYWHPEFREDPIDPGEARERFLALAQESVRMRLMSEVPLGVFLSGGIDSSGLVALTKREMDRPVKTFSIGYESDGDPECPNELSYAEQVARSYGTDHHPYLLSAKEFREALPKVAWHLDEPLADPSAVPLYVLSKFAKQYVTVILSGEGMDEILGGYEIYRKMIWLDRIRRLGRPLLPLLPMLQQKVRSPRLKKYLFWATLPLERRYMGVSSAFLPEHKRALMTEPWGADGFVEKFFDQLYEKTRDQHPLNQMLHLDLSVWLPDEILTKADRMTMAHAQELRVPFLDHRLVEFAGSLPVALKRRGANGKVLLRDAMASALPQEILRRPKEGFPIPRSWFLTEVVPLAQDLLNDRSGWAPRLFKAVEVERLFREMGQGVPREKEIFNLLMLELWYKSYFKEHGPVTL